MFSVSDEEPGMGQPKKILPDSNRVWQWMLDIYSASIRANC